MQSTTMSNRNQADTKGPAWYCLRSQCKHEHIAAAHIRILNGVTVFCPRIRFKRPTRQGLVWVTEAMFPGYLFAYFDLEEKHRQVRYAPSVVGIVQFGNRYPIIEEGVLAILRDQTGVAEVIELTYGLSQGDEVKIVGGIFAGLEAVVTQILSAKERVKVLMDFFDRQMEAEVERSSVLPRTVHPLAV
jgi:transcriptional antiterminator RfaH